MMVMTQMSKFKRLRRFCRLGCKSYVTQFNSTSAQER